MHYMRTSTCFIDEGWQALLKPARDNATRSKSAREQDASVDETEGILFALAQAVEQRDHQTAGHCERLAFMSVALGTAMQLDRPSLLALYRGGYLHDIGKVGIPDSILFKRASLTADEWITMRSHTTRGEEICRHLNSLQDVLPIIRHHHERWDGSGYPDGLAGEQIPLLARVLQAADIYDALTNARPYKLAFAPARALEIMREETERGWRDPEVMSVFFRLHDKVISKISEYNAAADRNLLVMRESLSNLQQFLSVSPSPAC
ncbi:MAG TPA: HD domain-containing phosphohydrolase [Bryobacteraceae bacterium]|nr:HD domain-containing phosphohydrolase [Bryobacteraceae bacterium]